MTDIAIISDLHVGSIVGLWPGSHPVEGGGLYEANKPQRWLYEVCWKDTVRRIKALDRPILVINGDAIHGVNPKDGQLVTNNKAAQVRAAFSLLEELASSCSRLFMLRGTEWHEGRASEDAEALAQLLGAEVDPETGQYTRYEMFLETGFGGVIHFGHHIGCSSVPWYEATVPLRDGLMLLAELARFYGRAAPQVEAVVRSHRHRYMHLDVPPSFQVIVTPGYQLKTAFMHKKTASMLPQVGHVVLSPGEDGLAVSKKIYELPPLGLATVRSTG